MKCSLEVVEGETKSDNHPTVATAGSRFNRRGECDNVRTQSNRRFEMVFMSLDKKDVIKIAHLARLDITEAEVAATTESLSRILGLIEQMNAVDTRAVAPMAHPQDAALRLRDDRVTEPDQRDKFQKIAPATEAGLYLVPKVIE